MSQKIKNFVRLGPVFDCLSTKWGCPHALCILFPTLNMKVALLQRDCVYNIISAEIQACKSQLSREVILQLNIHNVCSECNPSSVYMNDEMCPKRLPKNFVIPIEQNDAQLYGTYRRRSPQSSGETSPRNYCPKRVSLLSLLDTIYGSTVFSKAGDSVPVPSESWTLCVPHWRK